MQSATVEIVIPVHNEQATLAASITRLRSFLSDQPTLDARIVIADNASTDMTPSVAAALAAERPDVRALSLTQKGRGRALRAAWSASEAELLCYMDVDLSTDLRAFRRCSRRCTPGRRRSRLGRGSRPPRR